MAALACGDDETSAASSGSGATSSSASAASSSAGQGGAGGGGSGGSGQGGSGGGAAMSVEGESRTIRSCAPDDGPAMTIEIGLAAKDCSAPPGSPFLRLTFYTHVDSPAGNVFNLGSSGDAQAIYTPGGDPSNVIGSKGGTLTVDAWDMTSAKGSYDIVLNDGTHLAGTFDAIGCLTDPPMCG